jgi:hypothetical protein
MKPKTIYTLDTRYKDEEPPKLKVTEGDDNTAGKPRLHLQPAMGTTSGLMKKEITDG